MPPSKSKNPTPAETSRLALAEAERTHQAALNLHSEALTTAEEMSARLRSASAPDLASVATYAAELSQAEYVEKVAGLWIEGTEAAVKRARSGLVNDDVRVAELLADVPRAMYGTHARVLVVAERRQVIAPDDGTPTLYVMQDKPSTDDGGLLSGNVELTLYRPRIVSPLDARDIERECEALGYRVETQAAATSHVGQMEQDTVRVKVRQASPFVPLLPAAPTEQVIRAFGQEVSGHLAHVVHYKGERRDIRYMGEGHKEDSAANLYRWETEGRESTDEGERMTATLRFRVTPSRDLADINVNEALREAVERYAGTVHAGIGRIVTVEAQAVNTGDYRERFDVTATLTLAYRVA